MATVKPRLVVLTDISNKDEEPDDYESMIRLLLYSTEFDIEALVATASCFFEKEGKPIRDHLIPEILDEYEKVHPNLLKHSPDYPTADYFRSVYRVGCETGMKIVGDGKNTPGSDIIISEVDKEDDRPVWVTIWGGATTLAQALRDVRSSRSSEEVRNFVAGLRVYDILGQDDAGAWICHTFPDIFYIRSRFQFSGMASWTNTRHSKWHQGQRGGNEYCITPLWMKRNLQSGHGPLGEIYPVPLWTCEGDTPSFLHLLPNGLHDPERPEQGGWGGRFTAEKVDSPSNSTKQDGNAMFDESPYRVFSMYEQARDRWQHDGVEYNTIQTPLFRWREAFQNDFAARMDRCVLSYEEVNHNPVVVVNGDSTKDVMYIEAHPGDEVVLDALKSSDPDGDELFYAWWIYRDVTQYNGKARVADPLRNDTRLIIPEDEPDGTVFHLILAVTDSGEPRLSSYRRIVVTVKA